LTGVTENPTALQVVATLFAIPASGLIVAVRVKFAPVHPPDRGVTVYVAVWLTLVRFVRLPLILAWFAPAAPPVIPPVTTGAAHEYVVPAGTVPLTPFTGVNVNTVWSQDDPAIGFIEAFGLTVTVTVKLAPVHPPPRGVTVYVAVCAVAVVLLSVPKILAWLTPAAPPVIPPVTTGTGQEYCVPAGTISAPLTGVTENATAVQVVATLFAMVGFALTVTVTVNVGPEQLAGPGVFGVTV
jgi:hypothetical protein